MCLNPIEIRSPTKNIVKCGGQLLSLKVPCGQCAECVQTKRNEWYLRSYYEVQNTLNKGGYVLFDTLTYNDANIPKLSHYIDIAEYGVKDFTCFSHRHFKLFLKRLRRRLEYKYGNCEFKYFLTSEYGEDDRYTHRPHYHILFYVTCPCPPLEFSQLISECWQYGRTDGLPFQSVSYVAEHVYGRDLGYGSNTEFTAISNVCMYVSKYITKSNKFRKKLLKRMDVLKSKIDDDEKLKELFRTIDMFHRQSQGFGLSYLQTTDARLLDLLNDDKVGMPDRKKVFKTFPMPMYYKRHLHYTMKKRKDKTRYWELTYSGFRHTINKKLCLVDDMVLNFIDVLKNTTDDNRTIFYKLLGNRDISDYVIYELFYKGRSRHNYAVSHYQNYVSLELNDIESNLYDWIKVLRSASKSNSVACEKCHLYFDDDNVILISNGYEQLRPEYNGYIYRSVSKKDYIDTFCINERSCSEFKDFDKIGEFFEYVQQDIKKQKQTTFDYTEEYKQRMKNILFNNKH